MSLGFLNGPRRMRTPNTGGVQTAVGGVLNPAAATPSAAAPAPVNQAADLSGGIAGGTAVPAAAAPARHGFPFNFGAQGPLGYVLGRSDDLIGRLTQRMLARRGF